MREQVLKEAWRLRQLGCYTMRDIADRLKVDRDELTSELDAWLKKQANKACTGRKASKRVSKSKSVTALRQ